MDSLTIGMQFHMMEQEIKALRDERDRLARWKDVSERAMGNAVLTPREAAGFLRISDRTLRRREAAGRIRRCPNLGAVVRYRARDVLRLASAR